MIRHLKEELEPALRTASKVFIAAALINEEGYQFIENTVPPSCVRHYLVGINLPSCPRVLQDLLEKQNAEYLAAKVYFDKRITYHPKVYIIETPDQGTVAFVGSGNATGGGFARNIEMSLKICDPVTCNGLIEWFEHLFGTSHPLTETFIDRYTANFKKRKRSKATEISDLNNLFEGEQANRQPEVIQNPFFDLLHYEALANPTDHHSPEIRAQRIRVSQRLRELHHRIYPFFHENDLTHLSCHHHSSHIVSSPVYRRGFNQRNLRHIWLNYGYRTTTTRLIDHPRLQVVLTNRNAGIWLIIGKNGGSEYERNEIIRKMTDPAYRRLWYNLLTDLGNSYRLRFGDRSFEPGDITDPEHLQELFQLDNLQHYLIISRDYLPDDPAISDGEIANTVLSEFQRLHAIYDLIRDTRRL